MATTWEHMVFVIGEAAAMPGAIQALDIAFPCDDGASRDPSHPELYGCQLSANGQLPATHYGSAFVVTEQIRQSLEKLGLANVPGITYWRASNPEGILTATNHAPSQAAIGSSWEWDQCLAALALQPVNIRLK